MFDQSIVIRVSFYLVETHFRVLEGCYGFYRTFSISNLTPKPKFGFFHKPPFPNKESHLKFSFLFCFPFKNKTKISGNSKSFSKK